MRRSYVVLALPLMASYAALYLLLDLSSMLVAVALTIGVGITRLTWLALTAAAHRHRSPTESGKRRGGADATVAWAGLASTSADCSSGSSGFSGDCGAGAV